MILDNRLCFQKSLLEEVKITVMAIDKKIKNRKLQCDINRAAVKISALCSGKIDKYKSMKSDEILPSQQHAILTEVKFTYSPL